MVFLISSEMQLRIDELYGKNNWWFGFNQEKMFIAKQNDKKIIWIKLRKMNSLRLGSCIY